MRQEDERPELGDLEQALAGTPAGLQRFVGESHPADLADWMQELDDPDRRRVFELLSVEHGAEVLQRATDAVRETVVEDLSPAALLPYVEEMPADDAVDVLALVDESVREAVLRDVDISRAQGLRELSTYEPDSAGGIMTTEYVAVPLGTRVGDAIKEVKSEEGPGGEEEVGVFVIDERGKPVGFVSDRALVTSGIHTPIEDAMETELVVAHVDDDQEDVARQVLKYSALSVPVIDASGVLVGVITADDVGDVIEEEVEEDLRRIVGTGPEEQTRLSVLRRVRSRLPLMGLTVLGGIVTARILDIALPSAGGSVEVLRYLPIIIGLAGNVGIQSSTILVRAFATGEVLPERERAVVRSEILVGMMIGVICGFVTWGFAAKLENDAALGRAVGSAIVVAVTWAAALGGTIPVVCRRVGIDPAIVAGPFLITLSDISGAAIFVGVAHMMLSIG